MLIARREVKYAMRAADLAVPNIDHCGCFVLAITCVAGIGNRASPSPPRSFLFPFGVEASMSSTSVALSDTGDSIGDNANRGCIDLKSTDWGRLCRLPKGKEADIP